MQLTPAKHEWEADGGCRCWRVVTCSARHHSSQSHSNAAPRRLRQQLRRKQNNILLRVQSALKNGQEKQKIETAIDKCKAAVFNASKRSDDSFLRDIFYRHQSKEGGISVATLKQALVDADAPVVPDCEADAAAAISRFDTNYNGLMDFRAFVCAGNAPDELALFFKRL